MPKLSEDVYSHFYNGKTGANRQFEKYGSKGDEVRIIADHDNIVIVEDKSGNKYPVKKEKILINA